MCANEVEEVIRTDSLERRAKKGGGAVNSLLCRLLSRMNEAEREGGIGDNWLAALWVILRTSTVFHPLCPPSAFSTFFAPPLPLCMSHPSPDRRQLWHHGCPDFCLPRRGFIDSHQVAWHSLTLGNNSHVTLATANAPQEPRRVFFPSLV